jgi:hypothetical protein
MNKVADPTKYAGCSNNGFTSDSWIPSIYQNVTVCAAGAGGRVVTTAQCGTTGLVDGGRFGTAPNNVCYGCLDTTRIVINLFTNPVNPSGTPLTDFNARYLYPVSGPCLTWVQDMTFLWNYYYYIKYVYYNPLLVRVNTVSNSFLVSSVGYHDMLSKVGTNISSVINSL